MACSNDHLGLEVEAMSKISDTLDEVDRELREEENTLLKLKELILKEIRVLKARIKRSSIL